MTSFQKNNNSEILLSNNESLIFIENYENNEIYKFINTNNDNLYIVFNKIYGFELYKTYQDFINKINYISKAIKIPNIKKLDITYKIIDIIDNINIFEFNGIKIGHINTTFERVYNPIKNIYEPTKNADTTEYLLIKNDISAILLYSKNFGYSIDNNISIPSYKKINKNKIFEEYNLSNNSNNSNNLIDIDLLETPRIHNYNFINYNL